MQGLLGLCLIVAVAIAPAAFAASSDIEPTGDAVRALDHHEGPDEGEGEDEGDMDGAEQAEGEEEEAEDEEADEEPE